MPSFTFPFTAVSSWAAERPLLPVIIGNPANDLDVQTWGIIDTGADRSTFPEHVAKSLYHSIKHNDVQRDNASTVGGEVPVYKHTFSLGVFSLKKTKTGVSIGSEIVIHKPQMLVDVVPVKFINAEGIEVQTNFHSVILGVDDFLADYLITINYPQGVFSFEW